MTTHGGSGPAHPPPRAWAGCRFQWAQDFVGDGRDCLVLIATHHGLLRWVAADVPRAAGGWIAAATLAAHVAAGRVVVTWCPPDPAADAAPAPTI